MRFVIINIYTRIFQMGAKLTVIYKRHRGFTSAREGLEWMLVEQFGSFKLEYDAMNQEQKNRVHEIIDADYLEDAITAENFLFVNSNEPEDFFADVWSKFRQLIDEMTRDRETQEATAFMVEVQ